MEDWMQLDVRLPLKRFDLTVQIQTNSATLGVFGPSGSGKTSLLEMIAGLRRGGLGRVVFQGVPWFDSAKRIFVKPQLRNIGYVPQDHLLFPHKSVRENLLWGASRARAKGVDVGAMLEQVVVLLDLKPLLGRGIETLSGGERQRVCLGRALCSGPDLLLMDEPLSALDGALKERILPFLLRIKEDFSLPMIIVSHQPMELQVLCDSVVALQEGQVMGSGRPTEVFISDAVYRMIADRGLENLLSATVLQRKAGGTHCRLRLGHGQDGQIVVAAVPGEPACRTVMIGLYARDIMIATTELRGISARNQLFATIVSIQRSAGRLILTAVLSRAEGCPPVCIELTEASAGELQLEEGAGVWLVFKSSSVIVYG